MYGIIDIGSNTIRLALYEVTDGKIRLMINKKYTAGLANYIKKGRLSPKGIKKAIDILTEFQHILEYIHVRELHCLATASFRNIENTDEVISAIKTSCGLDITVLTGTEEALYDYHGAMQSINEPKGIVVDIGGGSTELVIYENGEIKFTDSLPLGSLTAYTACVKQILPTIAERKKITDAVQKELTAHAVPAAIGTDTICGIGGTIRAASKLYAELSDTAPAARLDISAIQTILNTPLTTLTPAILKTAPERIHTLIPGLIILITIARHWNCTTLLISKSGVKEGYLAAILTRRGDL